MAASLKELLSKAKSKSMYFGFGKGKDKKSHTLILNPSKAVNESEVKKENKAAQSVCVGKTEPKEGSISLIVTGGSPGASMEQWLVEACKAAGIPAPKFEIVTKSDVDADEQQVEQPPLKEGGENQLNSKTDKQATQESPHQERHSESYQAYAGKAPLLSACHERKKGKDQHRPPSANQRQAYGVGQRGGWRETVPRALLRRRWWRTGVGVFQKATQKN